MTGTAVATNTRNVRELLTVDTVRERIEPFLPDDVKYERVIAACVLATRNNAALKQCTGDSIVQAVAKILQWGLEIGVTAHLVPFKDVCTPIADYKGIAELMQRSGAVRHVEMRVVYENDQFSYEYGLDARMVHVPVKINRGKIAGAYCILRLPFGRSAFEYMPVEDIDAIRKRYSKQWKDGDCPAWYAKKTVVRQAAKLIPKDPRLAAALNIIHEEEELETGEVLEAGAKNLRALIAPPKDEEFPGSRDPDTSDAPTLDELDERHSSSSL